MTDEEFVIWCAGFFDGEGCIHLRLNSVARNSTGGSWIARVQVSQNDGSSDILRRIQLRFGGTICRNGNGKTNKRLEFCGKAEGVAFVKAILPWLIVKRDQAEMYLEFCRLGTYSGGRITDEARERRLELIREGKEAKHG